MARLRVRPGFRAPALHESYSAVANALRDGLYTAEAVEAETDIPAERVHRIAQGFEKPTPHEERLLRHLAQFAEAVAELPDAGEWGDLVARLVSPDVADDHDIIDNL